MNASHTASFFVSAGTQRLPLYQHACKPPQPFGGFVPIGNTTAYQVNIGAGTTKPAAGGARRLLAGRRLSQITAAQAEAEAVIAQSVENIYSLGAVAPRGQATYEWLVPDSAAPGPNDGDAVAYAYVSGVDHIKHINAGLVGAVMIYNKGSLPSEAEAAKELPMLYNIQNEMQSELFERNLAAQRKATGLKIDNTVSVRDGICSGLFEPCAHKGHLYACPHCTHATTLRRRSPSPSPT